MAFQLSDGPIPIDGDGSEVAGSITLPVQLSFLPGRAKNKLHMTTGMKFSMHRADEVIATAHPGLAGGMQLELNSGLTLFVSAQDLVAVMLELAEAVEKVAKKEIYDSDKDND